MPAPIQVNELTLDDRLSLVRRAFRKQMQQAPSMDEPWDMDVIAVFDSTVIAKDWMAKTHTAYPYTISDAGEVAFGDPMPVDVVYRSKEGAMEVVVANQPAPEHPDRIAQGVFSRLLNFLKVESHSEQEGAQPVNKEELVTVLVANKRCQFGKDKLAQWDLEDLQTLQASLQETADGRLETTDEQPTANSQPPAVNSQQSAASGQQSLQLPAEITQFAQMIANLGGVEKLGEALGSISAHADQDRQQLIAGITANERNTFEEPELQAMATAQLRKLASAFAPRNYLGAAGALYSNGLASEWEPLAMPKWPHQVKEANN